MIYIGLYNVSNTSDHMRSITSHALHHITFTPSHQIHTITSHTLHHIACAPSHHLHSNTSHPVYCLLLSLSLGLIRDYHNLRWLTISYKDSSKLSVIHSFSYIIIAPNNISNNWQRCCHIYYMFIQLAMLLSYILHVYAIGIVAVIYTTCLYNWHRCCHIYYMFIQLASLLSTCLFDLDLMFRD